MPIPVSDSGGHDFEPFPEATHQAICYSVVDLGTQNTPWGPKEKVMISWEFPEVRIDIEEKGRTTNKPRVLSKTYTKSLAPKSTLRKDLEKWRGQKFTPEQLELFDMENLLGVKALIETETGQKENGDPRTDILRIKPNGGRAETENPILVFSFTTGGPIPDSMPDWLAEKVRAAQEWRGGPGGGSGQMNQDGQTDEIPF